MKPIQQFIEEANGRTDLVEQTIPGKDRDDFIDRYSKTLQRSDHLASLGFTSGGIRMHEIRMHKPGGATQILEVEIGLGTWEDIEPAGKYPRSFPVSFLQFNLRKNHMSHKTYYSDEMSRHPAATVFARWVAAEFAEPFGLMDYVPKKFRYFRERDAEYFINHEDPKWRQWMILNLARIK